MGSKLSQLTEAITFTDSDEFYVELNPGGSRLPRRAKNNVLQHYLPLPMNGITGLTLSNNVSDANNDIDIAAGRACAASGDYNLILTSALTKQLDASWAVGTNQGGLDSGGKANSTWYHVWVIGRVDTNVTDILFSTSATAPTMPANYTMKRRIGAIRTDSSGNLIPFLQYGDDFLWKSPPFLDINDATLTTTKKDYTLSGVPAGIVVMAMLNIRASHASAADLYVSNPNLTDINPSSTATPLATISTYALYQKIVIATNTSAQISVESSTSSTTIKASALGWTDPRGKW